MHLMLDIFCGLADPKDSIIIYNGRPN